MVFAHGLFNYFAFSDEVDQKVETAALQTALIDLSVTDAAPVVHRFHPNPGQGVEVGHLVAPDHDQGQDIGNEDTPLRAQG